MISPPCAGSGTDVDDPIGRPDRLFVVLDHEDRIAEVAEPGQGRDELGVVALMEPDRRLVEDVQDAHQGRPICVARRIRWASPPDSVTLVRSSVR